MTNDLDESMSPPEMATEQTIPLLSSNSYSGEIEKFMGQIVNFNNNVIHEPTCLVCSSPCRKDIENMRLEGKPNSEIINLCKTKTNIEISDDILANHMTHHMDKGVKELQKLEYIDRIRRYTGTDFTTLDSIKLGIAAIYERLFNLNAIVPNGDTTAVEIEKIKSSETARLMSTLNNLLKLKAGILGEMKDNGEVISIPTKSFIDVFNQAIAEANNDKERSIIKTILSKLSNISKSIQ